MAFREKTTNSTPLPIHLRSLNRDGVVQLIFNILATNLAVTDWAAWISLTAIITRSAGVVTVQSPTGPQTADRGTSSIWTVEIAVDNVMPHMVNVVIKGENGVTVEWMIDSSIEILVVQ